MFDFDSKIFDMSQYLELCNKTFIISKTDEKGIITYANQKFCDISGYKEEELIGKPHNIVRHPRVPSSLFKELWDTIQSGKTFNGVIRNKAKDGSSYITDVNIFPLTKENKEKEYLSIRTDITQFALTQEDKILNASNKLKVIINSDGRIINYNDKAVKNFHGIKKGLLIQDILGKEEIETIIRDTLFGNNTADNIIKYKSKTYTLEIETLTEDIILSFTDISDIIELQEQYNKKVLENKDKMLLVFTHELKTPLNGILGFSEILSKRLNRKLEKEITTKDIIKYIDLTDDINKLGYKLMDSITALLDSSKVNNGQYQISRTHFNLSNLLKNKISMISKIYHQDIIYDIDDFDIFTDKQSIEHIFANLLSNACKYGDSKVYVSLKQSNSNFELTVEDNGKGIDEANRSKIFEMFEQLDNQNLSRDVEGTGIGLHFVKSLCDLLEYSIEIKKSDKLGGACFIISGKLK